MIDNKKLENSFLGGGGERLVLNGCEVILKDSQIIPETRSSGGKAEKGEVAELLREVVNAPELTVRKDGKPLSGEEFRAWRKNLWEDEKFVRSKEQKDILKAIQLNRLSKNRIDTIGDIVRLLADEPESVNWRNQYEEIAKDFNGPGYSAMSEKEKTKLMKKFEDLAVGIYNKL